MNLLPQATFATIGTTKKVRHLASIWGDREAEITCIVCYVCVIVGLCHVRSWRRVDQSFAKRLGSSAQRRDSRREVQSGNSDADSSETNRNDEACKVGSRLASIRQSEYAEGCSK